MNRRTLLLGCGSLALAGCGSQWATSYAQTLDPNLTRKWRVRRVSVAIPENLTVSNENSLAPSADIVWHGDPIGDRRAQVGAILRQGIENGAKPLRGGRPVVINVTLSRFHALTPAALERAPSAVHSITYMASVTDARTRGTLVPPQMIRADIEALTGGEAFVAITRGETQKVRIVNHLSRVTAGWLGVGPDPRRDFSGLGR